GGGGGGGGGPTPPTQPPPSVTFAPSSTGAGIGLAQGATTTSSTLVLEVRATQVTALYGVAFDLTYPNALLRLQGFRAGTFLSSGGAQISTQVAESSPGHLVVGLSRLGPAPGVDGSGVLLELQLDAVASGTGAFAFSNNAAYRPDGSVQSVGWNAGSVSVVR
ncbi:MAG TPA: cohesin domain-containing protein, partial [Thermoanaerobaculia bacterium]|nr:cohesin domain-containing protein [Thermoanaerobaculia bacterium]